MSAKPWVCLRLDGARTRHASRDAARRASRASKGARTVVEIRHESERLPGANDAQGWADYRRARGLSGNR